MVQFFGEKVATEQVGFALFPDMNGVGIHPFGVWSLWVWFAGLVGGFLVSDS